MIEKSSNLFPEVSTFFETVFKNTMKSTLFEDKGLIAGLYIQLYDGFNYISLKGGIHIAIAVRILQPNYESDIYQPNYTSEYMSNMFPFIENPKCKYYYRYYHSDEYGINGFQWDNRMYKVRRKMWHTVGNTKIMGEIDSYQDYSETFVIYGKINSKNIDDNLKSLLTDIVISDSILPTQTFCWEDDVVVSLENTMMSNTNLELVKIFFDSMNSRTVEIKKENAKNAVTKYKKHYNDMRMWNNRSSIRSFIRS